MQEASYDPVSPITLLRAMYSLRRTLNEVDTRHQNILTEAVDVVKVCVAVPVYIGMEKLLNRLV